MDHQPDALVLKYQALGDAAVGVLHGTIKLKATTRPKEVEQIIKAIRPESLISDVTPNKKIERAVMSVCQQRSPVLLPARVPRDYTVEELRKSLEKHLFEGIPIKILKSDYGIPERTLRRHEDILLDELRRHFQDSSITKDKLKGQNYKAYCQHVIDHLEFQQLGPVSPLNPVDRDILAHRMNYMDMCGVGLDAKGMSTFVQIHAQTTAETMDELNGTETVESRKLKDLKASPSFIRKHFYHKVSTIVDTDDGEIVEQQGKMSKVSPISLKRAAAGSPLNNKSMIEKFQKHDQLLIEEGVFGTEGPTAEDIINLDEIGFDPHGRMRKTYSLDRERNDRRYATQTGEHAPFWVSIIIAICANGDLLFPVVIHQGGKDDWMPGNFALRLNEDYRVTCTSSGYSDHDTFKVIASVISDYISQRSNKKKGHTIVYFDGHDSHFEPDAFDYMMKQNMSLRFLKSNDSINDQPLDNGLNALIAAKYSEIYNIWRIKNLGEKITPSIFNGLFSMAFESVRRNPATKSLIMNSFKKTGIFPLRNIYEDTQNTRRMLLSEPYICDSDDQQTVKRWKKNDIDIVPEKRDCGGDQGYSTDTAPDADIELITPDPTNPDIIGLKGSSSMTIAKEGTKPYMLLVQRAAYFAHNMSFMTPAQENQKLRNEERLAKSVKVKKKNTQKDCLKNPSTSTGLCVTADTINELQANIAAKKRRELEKTARRNERRKKLDLQYAEASEVVIAMLAKVTNRADDKKMSLEQMKTTIKGSYTVEKLKLACRFYKCKSTPPAASPKKDDYVLSISTVLHCCVHKQMDIHQFSTYHTNNIHGDLPGSECSSYSDSEDDDEDGDQSE